MRPSPACTGPLVQESRTLVTDLGFSNPRINGKRFPAARDDPEAGRSKIRRTTSPPLTTTSSAFDDMETPREPCIPPPIFLDLPIDWIDHLPIINRLVGGNFTVTCDARLLCIQTRTIAHFKAVQRYLWEQNIPFVLQAERPLKVVIKGLPPDVMAKEIVDELRYNNMACTDARRIMTKRGIPSGLWLVTIGNKDGCRAPSEIYNCRRLFYRSLEVRKYTRWSGPIRCAWCQGVGHISSDCRWRARCVRYGDHYDPISPCPKQAEAPKRYSNCGAEHSANYRGRRAYKENEQICDAATVVAARTARHSKRQSSARTPSPLRPTARGFRESQSVNRGNRQRPRHRSVEKESAQRRTPSEDADKTITPSARGLTVETEPVSQRSPVADRDETQLPQDAAASTSLASEPMPTPSPRLELSPRFALLTPTDVSGPAETQVDAEQNTTRRSHLSEVPGILKQLERVLDTLHRLCNAVLPYEDSHSRELRQPPDSGAC